MNQLSPPDYSLALSSMPLPVSLSLPNYTITSLSPSFIPLSIPSPITSLMLPKRLNLPPLTYSPSTSLSPNPILSLMPPLPSPITDPLLSLPLPSSLSPILSLTNTTPLSHFPNISLPNPPLLPPLHLNGTSISLCSAVSLLLPLQLVDKINFISIFDEKTSHKTDYV